MDIVPSLAITNLYVVSVSRAIVKGPGNAGVGVLDHSLRCVVFIECGAGQ